MIWVLRFGSELIVNIFPSRRVDYGNQHHETVQESLCSLVLGFLFQGQLSMGNVLFLSEKILITKR